MRFRDQVALTLPALVLRLVLAVVFLWAGIAKFASTTTVTGEDAARLSNLGIHLVSVAPQTAEPAPPIEALPDPAVQGTPDEGDQEQLIEPILDNTADEQRLQEILDETKRRAEQAKEQAEEDAKNAIEEHLEQAPIPDPPAELGGESQAFTPLAYTMVPVQQNTSNATASDFPQPMSVRRVYTVALLLDECANPGLTAESQPINSILPNWFGGPTAKYLAIAAGVVEVLAGLLLLLGFMTRLSALGTMSVMLVALWTTQFGPAAMQSTDALLGFIPNHGDFWDTIPYTLLFLQLALTAMSIAVFFLGSGPVGMDRVIFGSSHRDKYIHGDPKAAQQAAKDRDPFDRSPNPTP